MSILRIDDSARWYLFFLFPFCRYQKTIHACSSFKKKGPHVLPSFSHLQHKDKIIQKEAVTSIIHGERFGLLINRPSSLNPQPIDLPKFQWHRILLSDDMPSSKELTSCPNPPACMSIRPAAPQPAGNANALCTWHSTRPRPPRVCATNRASTHPWRRWPSVAPSAHVRMELQAAGA